MIKTFRCRPTLAAALLATIAAPAHADFQDMFKFSGFATAGAVVTDTSDVEYATAGQVRGATKSISTEVDTKIAGQVNARFSPMFSATVQVMSRADGDGNWTPGLEWAFVKAQLTPGFSLRVGRIGAPIFALSDYRNVGYVYPWVRPPVEVYGQVSFSSFDGADLDYQAKVGPAMLNVQLFGGVSKSDATGLRTRFYDMKGFNSTLEFDNGISLRMGEVQGRINVYSTGLSQLSGGVSAASAGLLAYTGPGEDTMHAYGASMQPLGDTINPRGFHGMFRGVGISYDHDNWITSFEYAERKTNSFASDTASWYASLGYRFGKFTPYVTYAQVRVRDYNLTNTVPPLNPGLIALHAGVDALRAASGMQQKTPGLGVRWDIMRNIAVKAQYERVNPETIGMFIATSRPFDGSPVNVYSLCVDTVF